MLGDFSCFCCCLLTFSFDTFSRNCFRNTIRVSNCFDPDLGPNCLQRLVISRGQKSLLAAKKKLKKDHETHMHKEISSNKERIPSRGLHLL